MKKWVSLFFAVVFAFALASVAYAHSGGTDSWGGHKNHSTGEYHYHHGYSAHQHEDLDGDGDLECLYEESLSNNPFFVVGFILFSAALVFLPALIHEIKKRRKPAIKHYSRKNYVPVAQKALDDYLAEKNRK